jgi:hypothetical protein
MIRVIEEIKYILPFDGLRVLELLNGDSRVRRVCRGRQVFSQPPVLGSRAGAGVRLFPAACSALSAAWGWRAH